MDLSETTGRLPEELRVTLRTLLRLLGDNTSGDTMSANPMVLLLAQLDSLLGISISRDARLLPFLLQGYLEALQLIQP